MRRVEWAAPEQVLDSSLTLHPFGQSLSASGLWAYLAQLLRTNGDVPVRSWCIVTSSLRVTFASWAGGLEIFAAE